MNSGAIGSPGTVGGPDTVVGLPPDVAELVLGLADDELIIGHRHSEWLGLSPFLEEDLSLASIGQDELGHARALYAIVWPEPDQAGTQGPGFHGPGSQGPGSHEPVDVSVMKRVPSMYRSCDLVELGPGTWERSLVRHLLYDLAEPHRWEHLGRLVSAIATMVPTVLAEERFHRTHAVALVTRLISGSDDARRRLQGALDGLWPMAIAMIDGQVGSIEDEQVVLEELRGTLRSTGLDVGDHVNGDTSKAERVRADRRNRHDDFTTAHASFVEVFAFDPQATW